MAVDSLTEEEKVRILFHCMLEIAKTCKIRGCPQIGADKPCWCMEDAQKVWEGLQVRGIDIVYAN